MTYISVRRNLILGALTVLIGSQIEGIASAEESLAQAPPVVTHVQSAFGTIAGVVRNQAKLPVAGATVTAARLDGNGIRSTISGSDGIYSFADVPPGAYSLTSESEGYLELIVSTVQVQVGRATRTDMAMVSPTGMPGHPEVSSPPVVAKSLAPSGGSSSANSLFTSKAAPAADENSTAGFWKRWAKGNVPTWKDLVTPARKPNSSAVASLGTPPASAFNQPVLDTMVASAGAPGGSPDPAPIVAPAPSIPEALQAPPSTPGVDNVTPFAFADFTWLNGNARTKDTVLDTKFFTPEIRFDTNYTNDTNQPKDHTLGGSTETFRSGEVQEEQISFGGDFHWQNVRGRVLTMFGEFATTTPRNDASTAVGQWDLRDAYRYVSEAWGGYHFDVNHGLNVDAGIFVSYIGLFSYYNFDNWAYQPSYVSSNTPWFFNGVRVQWFPTNKLKIEPWFINGWQSYAKFNSKPGLGGQVKWTPNGRVEVISNNYGYGTDTLGNPRRQRIHTDNSLEVKYFDDPENNGLSKMAFSLTGDLGCEYGGGVTCHGGKAGPKQAFLGWMAYNRFWFHKDLFGLTLGGGMMSNPGRYLTLLPPINGADAISGSPYFTANPGDKFHAYDATVTFDYMPKQYITWRFENGYRHSDVPYWTGRGGLTPPGGNNGSPGSIVILSDGSEWKPDLRRSQFVSTIAVMVKF